MRSPKATPWLTFLRCTGLFVFVLMLLAWPAAQPVSAVEQQAQYQPTDQIIIKFRSQSAGLNADAQAIEQRMSAINTAAGLELNFVRSLSNGADVLSLPERVSAEQALALSQRLMTLPNVEYAEPDTIVEPAFIPNDPFYPNQKYLSGTYGIGMPEAWAITQGSANVTIAVLDTGITSHTDIDPARLWQGYDFISSARVAADRDGRDSDPSDSGDWITADDAEEGFFKNCKITDSTWHGTHTTGILIAKTNNAAGVAGIDWKAKVLPVRVVGKCGGYMSDLIDGMRWAAGLKVAGVSLNQHPANVLSVSLTGYAPSGCSASLQSAINEIHAAKKVIVAAAGNNGTNASLYEPGSCTHVITVTATNANGEMPYYSNRSSVVALSAPGGDFYVDGGIVSTSNTGTSKPEAPAIKSRDGTSFSAAQVSGVASLMLSINPALTPDQIRTFLRNSTKPFAPGSGAGGGTGILDAEQSLRKVQFTAWSGSLSVTSNRAVVAVARPHIGEEITSYDGVPAGGLTAYVPALYKKAGGGVNNAALYIQNLDPVDTATINIKYYSNVGSLTCSVDDTVKPKASKAYWTPTIACLPVGWTGSAVITSTENITAVARPHFGTQIFTYNGFTSGSPASYLPMLFKNAYGGTYSAAFQVQNMDAVALANITIKFIDDSGTETCSLTDTIGPLVVKEWWLPSLDAACLPAGWVGGVVVTSDTDILSVARLHVGPEVMAYSGFTGGASSMYVPMLFKKAFGGTYNAAFYVQNLDNAATGDITVDFYDNAGNLTCSILDTLAPRASRGYWAPSIPCLPLGWAGGAVVTSTTDIVAVGRPHVGAQVTTYNGIAAGGTSQNVPMLFSNAFGGSYNSAVYIQNTDTANSASVTLRFYDTAGTLLCTTAGSIPAKATMGYWLPSVVCQ